MQFDMKQRNYIVCPKCKNDVKFECFWERVHYGIFSIRIQCQECKWVSDELYEETGYFPDLNKDTIRYHVQSLHDMQQDNNEM